MKFRDRKFCAVLYPEDESHFHAIEKLQNGGYNFAAVLHDQDVYEDGPEKGQPKKSHWHVVIRFKNAIWSTALAKDLGIQPNYLEECRNVDGSLRYLVHEDNPEKAQYDFESVFGPLKTRLATLLADNDEGTRVLTICDIIDNSPGLISFSELIRKSVAAGTYGDLRKMGTFAVQMVREHNEEFSCTHPNTWATENDKRQFKRFCEFTGDKDILPLD